MERRHDRRYEITARVRMRYGKRSYLLEVGNVSRGGAFIRSGEDSPPWLGVGRPVELSILAPQAKLDGDLSLTGRVAHIHESELGRVEGFGVRFDPPDAPTTAVLEQLLEWAAGDTTRPPALPQR